MANRFASQRQPQRGLRAVLLLALFPAVPIGVQAASFCSAGPIVSGGHAFGRSSPYPSIIDVAGTSGTVSRVQVTLAGLTHGFPDDLDLRLTSPSGRTVVLMSDVGGSVPANDVTITFSDDASADLPHGDGAIGLGSGTFRPRNQTQDVVFDVGGLPMPSATQPHASTLEWLRGESPNGGWRLFAWDDAAGEGHDLAIDHWCLDLETASPGPCRPGAIDGEIDTSSPVLTSLPIDYDLPSTCGHAWQCRTREVQQGVRYALHSFVNEDIEARCVTATVTVGTCRTFGGIGGLTALGYVGDFDPGQICTHAIGASGDAHVPRDGTEAPNGFSFEVPGGAEYHIAVIEAVSGSIVHPGDGCTYSLLVSPGTCSARQ